MLKAMVLGGGLSGLAAAHTLVKNGIETLLLESDKTLGGLASSYFIDGEYVPKTYHHVMYGDTVTLGIIRELNLEKDLYWKKLKVGFYSKGQFYDFSSSASILKFKPISLWGRARFGFLVLRARRKTDWQDLDGVSVENYCLETAGKEAYKLVGYIVKAKFAEPPINVSAAWLMSRFGHESKSVSDQFGYLKGGIEQIVRGLAEKCKENGTIAINARATRIVVESGRVQKVEYQENGEKKEAKPDILVSTLPVPALLDVAEGLPKEYEDKLRNIKYKSSLCAAIALSKEVSSFYWLNIMDLEKHPFVGVFEHGHLNNNLRYPNILFVVKYLNATDSYWQKPDQEIVEEFLSHLSEIFDCNMKEQVLWWRLHRAEYSTPLFTPYYSKYMPQATSPVNGLYIGGISRTYPRDRYMGTAFETGIEAAREALARSRQ